MHALPAHTVELVLQYIAPLSDPLPPHLVSAPLRQRHHFLQISPASPVDYLCWPSPDNAKVIDLLDHLPSLSDQASYTTRYTSDPESTFAHVQVSSNPEGLCMLFRWDDTHAWQYHDLRLMPFPSSSLPTPHESLAASSTPPSRSPPDLVTQVNQTHGDSYWDSYGATGHDLTSSSLPHNADTVEEDVYWAQYASVQGSADSTIPSPLPISRKLRLVDSNDDADESVPSFPTQNDPVIDVPIDALRSRPRPGPSPDTLARLLAAISPGKEVCASVHDGLHPLQLPSSHRAAAPEQTTAGSELITLPLSAECLDAAVLTPVAVKLNEEALSRHHPPRCHKTEDKALSESIRGLYYLWKTGRMGELGEEARDTFLRIVQEAIASE